MACRQQDLLLLQLTPLIWLALAVAAAAASGAKSGCPEKCGDVSIPFPFGIGDRCHIGMPWFNLSCNGSSNPAKPYWGALEILNISLQGQLTFSSPVAEDCYNRSGNTESYYVFIGLDDDAPFTLSSTRTIFTAIGCDTEAYIYPFMDRNDTTGCLSICEGKRMVVNNSCSGIGCCQASIPSGVKKLRMEVDSFHNHSRVLEFNPCSYAFLIDKDHFEFSDKDMIVKNKYERDIPVPVVVDWKIANETCETARRDEKTFACKSENSICNDTDGLGYRCDCKQGYRGNPYLTGGDGCVDIDECNENLHNCGEQICKNTEGGYYCKRRFNKLVALMILLGIGISLLFVLVISWIYWVLKRRKIIKLRDEFFRKNGGLLLQQQIASHGVTVATKIFSAEELERATNKYDETQIIGRGGYGTVYKGILPNHGTVAIKKSKTVDENQIEQFINEVFILSQINHRNVVMLLGCCLETEVPLLVYEFISNGTLSNHIHDEAHPSTLSLEDRLRIASETAGALAYLHFAASIPIFHRDVKSTNILLDNDLTAKVSDFGASRLIPLDQTQISTIIQGTLGYLDPEYLQTGQLTEKSDVYSFGVVLVELLTGEKPTSFTRGPEERNLSMYFLLSMKENSLFNVLHQRLVDEGGVEQLVAVSQLAKRCLSLNGDERPTMKEVAIELEELKRSFVRPRAQGKYEGTMVELCEPSEAYRGNDSVVGQDSLGNRSISLLEMAR
ncbi:putative wall-associated receptor kinase-like protein 16 [Cinnamomum micranthum f. kanehirae]|uniref:Putative wall-associated receptor kinase-like protein 16 n=1 Tax=Cinnamomum micranthum f. kanehirae TaxID=337451 RepID=A0A443NEL7_9MAGN|nr:putative wall-associated receptor kinase-like protein 16 [Cinnamomum micranthum f. kanehirae]